jgi:RNA polymerase sigma-70 factor, ECF subfamily
MGRRPLIILKGGRRPRVIRDLTTERTAVSLMPPTGEAQRSSGRPMQADDLERFRAYLGLLARLEVVPSLRDRVDLSGVVQQTLMDAHQALEERPNREQTDHVTTAWLRSILSHNLADSFRKLAAQKRDIRREWSLDAALEQSASRLERWLAAEQSSPSQRAIRHEELLRLAEVLAELPEAQRRAIELHHLQGMPLAEIAAELGSTKAAVAGLLHRGMKTLRVRLEPP